MKNIIFVSLALFLTSNCLAQNSLKGAYIAKEENITHLWLFVDNYSSYIKYTDEEFLYTWGGSYIFKDGQISIDVEYDTEQEGRIGAPLDIIASIEGGDIQGKDLRWIKQKNNPQNLDGVWRISGRQQEGSVSQIPRGDRKTVKILIDGYFQWIAINPTVKGFYGTGGGTYNFENGRYSEHILFFSRDNSRIGTTLTFNGELKNDQWHHSGKSSKGDPIYEIWSRD